MKTKILVIGACGQIGTELTQRLRSVFGVQNVVASDVRRIDHDIVSAGIFEEINALDYQQIEKIVIKYKITDVYLMAAMLSANSEKNPMMAWELNMKSLFNVLNLAKEKKIKKIFWPSSIAVFGSSSPKENTPQFCIMEPSTVYGISKQAGERWCEYYFEKHGVDVRSLRYPGLISWSSPPGGGTTDYAVEIFHKALADKKYNCFLRSDTKMPMMYMDDAINATLMLMGAPMDAVKIRSSYNVAAMSFSPAEIANEIAGEIIGFETNYEPDFRQLIADSWPYSIDDSAARADWGWKHDFDLEKTTTEMLLQLQKR